MESGLTLPMVFWHRDNVSIAHAVCSLVVEDQGVVTGGDTGEIVFWTHHSTGYLPRLIATPNINYECRQLLFTRSPPNPESPSGLLVISLHADNRVRVWDYLDGRCIAVTAVNLFSENFIIARICVIPVRFVAIAGSEKSIHILDVWSMTRLCSYKAQGELVDIVAGTKGERTRLASVHAEGFVTVWDFQDNGDIAVSPECNFAQPIAKLTMVTDEPPSKVAISKELDVIALAYERKISFIHESWVTFT